MSTEIPIWVNGEIRWLSGIDKKTTCRDVVEVLLDGEGIDKSEVKDFTIMERWRKVERPLDESSKILKIWSHWGDEKKEVRLCLRRLDNNVDCDSGRGSPIGSGSTPSLRRKRNRCRGHGKPPLAHPEGLHPRRLAELGTFDKRDYDDVYARKSTDGVQDETPTKNYHFSHQTNASNYGNLYNDNENVNCRKKKSYHCPSTGKLHSTPLADYTNARIHHGKKTGKCCSKRESKHRVRNSESIEKLMKLILAQGATIQSQLQKLKERDEQIEIIEQERHRERIEKNGRNYLLETYLGSLKEAEIPAEMEEEKADDSGVNTEGGSDQVNAIKRKNQECLKRNEIEPDSDPGPSTRWENIEGHKENSHHHHHHHIHHHRHNSSSSKSGRSKSESRTNEFKSTVANVSLKRTLSDNSITKGTELEKDPAKNGIESDRKAKDDVDDVVELKKIQSEIHMWEKVFKINKKLEKEEENLVRLHIKIKKIQNENYRFAKDAENVETLARITQTAEENEHTEAAESDLNKRGTETSEEQEKSSPKSPENEYSDEPIESDPDYLKIQQNLEALKCDLDQNSKEIYQNFTKLIEEDELVEQKRNCLTQLLSDLERTSQEEEMLNEMITMREMQNTEKTEQELGIPTPESSNIPLESNNMAAGLLDNVRLNALNAPQYNFQGGVNQRPEVSDDETQKTAQTLKPKIVKITFEDTVKRCNDSLEDGHEKSIREPGAVTAGALKGILKNRTSKQAINRDDIYGYTNNTLNESQIHTASYFSLSANNNSNHQNDFYGSYNTPNVLKVPPPSDVPFRNDYSYSATPYNNTHHVYETNYASVPLPAPNTNDLKTAYSLSRGPHTHDMSRTVQSSIGNVFSHGTMVKTKIPNDNDSSTSSDTSGLCSMYSSSPSVEQPYMEHSYILDTLV